MRVTPVVAFVSGILAVVAASSRTPVAQQLPLRPPPPAFAAPKAPQPFGDLFGSNDSQKRLAPLTKMPRLQAPVDGQFWQQRPSIACPMRMIAADPQFDATMRRNPPPNVPAFTLRAAPPLACVP